MEWKKILHGLWPVLIISGATLLSSLSSCKEKGSAVDNAKPQTNIHEDSDVLKKFDRTPTDFQEFYQIFHSDSVKQLEYIRFPLKGLPDNADPDDESINDFYFTQDQWIFHKNPHAFNELFSCSYLSASDMLVEENIIDKKNGLITIRRFAKTSDGWQLIYYAGMNKYSKISQ